MICESCKVNIGQEFTFAIKNNQCPACGKNIMTPEKLTSMLSLQELLKNNFNGIIDEEKIALLVVANFEIKQISKAELPKDKVIRDVSDEPPVTKNNIEVSDDDISDDEYKKKQMEDSKIILKSMRDEALNEAISDQWGLGNANGITDISNIREIADIEKKKQIQENILTGNKGSFRRT